MGCVSRSGPDGDARIVTGWSDANGTAGLVRDATTVQLSPVDPGLGIEGEPGEGEVQAAVDGRQSPAGQHLELGIAERAANLYNWGLGIGVILALGVLTYAGFVYTTSSGNPSRTGDAKKWIIAGLLGLLILFSSYLLLNTINPELTNLESIVLLLNPDAEFTPPEITLPDPGVGSFLPPPPTCYQACLAEPYNTPTECAGLPECPDAICPVATVSSFNSGWFNLHDANVVAYRVENDCSDIRFNGSWTGDTTLTNYRRDDRCRHGGYDLEAPHGTPVYAAEDGTIITVEPDQSRERKDDCGTKINLSADSGVTFRYCHLSDFRVAEGQRVAAGQVIGYVGATGNGNYDHLHFGYLDGPSVYGAGGNLRSIKVNSYVDYLCGSGGPPNPPPDCSDPSVVPC